MRGSLSATLLENIIVMTNYPIFKDKGLHRTPLKLKALRN